MDIIWTEWYNFHNTLLRNKSNNSFGICERVCYQMAMERVPQMVSVAREIFSQVRTAIVMKMRFLDMAVFRLKPVPAPVSFATDGDFLYYDPARLLKRFRKESNIVNRDYMLYMAIMKLLLRWMARFWKVVFRFANAKCLKAGWLFMKMN